jgi:tRNA (mo5U34)-methyltransferase
MPGPQVKDQRCLDIGTWDGFYAYEMERRGAKSVTALDLPDLSGCDWPPEVLADPAFDPHFQDRQPRSAAFHLLHEMLQSSVQWKGCNIYDVDPTDLGMFDVVVIGSLLVHLRDPVRALDAVRKVTRGHLLLVEYIHPPTQLRSRRRPIAELRGLSDDFQWWLPNDMALRRMLHVGGFTIEQVSPPFLLRLKIPAPPPTSIAATARHQAVKWAGRTLARDWTSEGHLHRAYLARPRF